MYFFPSIYSVICILNNYLKPIKAFKIPLDLFHVFFIPFLWGLPIKDIFVPEIGSLCQCKIYY